jgi:DNA replication protein DnaC
MQYLLQPPEAHRPQQLVAQRVADRHHPNLDRQNRPEMLQSVAITPGTGKTHLAIGLAIRACQAGHRVAFATASEWVARLAEAHHAGRLQPELVRLGRYPLLVVDEVGYIPFEAEAANLFFQLVSGRYERASMIVTSNKPFGRWGEVFGDDIVAAAMIDRLVHHAEVISLKGDSSRLKDRDLARGPRGNQPDE